MCIGAHYPNNMGAGFIAECLITFYTVENIKQFIKYQFEHWNEFKCGYRNRIHIYITNLTDLTYYEAYCFKLIDNIENWNEYNHHSGEDYWFETMRDFEHLCDYPPFMQHVLAYSTLSVDEQISKHDEQINFCKNIIKTHSNREFYNYVNVSIDDFGKNVDKFIFNDYLCENNIQQFVSYVFENNDIIGLHILKSCDKHITYNHPSFYKCLRDIFAKRVELEYCEIIMCICNIKPFMLYAMDWRQQKQTLLVNLHEQVFETYETGNIIHAVLCNDYIVLQICKFF